MLVDDEDEELINRVAELCFAKDTPNGGPQNWTSYDNSEGIIATMEISMVRDLGGVTNKKLTAIREVVERFFRDRLGDFEVNAGRKTTFEINQDNKENSISIKIMDKAVFEVLADQEVTNITQFGITYAAIKAAARSKQRPARKEVHDSLDVKAEIDLLRLQMKLSLLLEITKPREGGSGVHSAININRIRYFDARVYFNEILEKDFGFDPTERDRTHRPFRPEEESTQMSFEISAEAQNDIYSRITKHTKDFLMKMASNLTDDNISALNAELLDSDTGFKEDLFTLLDQVNYISNASKSANYEEFVADQQNIRGFCQQIDLDDILKTALTLEHYLFSAIIRDYIARGKTHTSAIDAGRNDSTEPQLG